MGHLTTSLFLVASLAMACDKTTPAPAPVAPPSPAGATNEPAQAAVEPSPEPAPKPHEKPPAPSEAGQVGTLPEGVGIAVGAAAPKLELDGVDGTKVALGELYARGTTLVVFYRGGWCPFCNAQLHALSQAAPEFARRGVGLAAISVDRADEGAKTRASWTIPFPVLADPELAAHRAFNVTYAAEPEEVERLRGFGIDLEKASGKTHHTIAIPALFLVDTQGIVRWAHADRDYKVRPSVAQLLAAIDQVVAREK